MDHIFLDTDIILDFLTGRVPHSSHAAEILTLAEKKELKAYVSLLTFSNAYYILRKHATHRKILELFAKLETIIELADIPPGILMMSLHSGFSGFEDALQNFTAESHPQIKILITRNTRDYKHSRLSVMSPVIYLKGRD
ncbi:MAG: PIN domain-containing protein [Bacteroidetes bacterium]|nr:PIN domain-containing protein [Bacteroidota bacterium]